MRCWGWGGGELKNEEDTEAKIRDREKTAWVFQSISDLGLIPLL